MTSGELSINRFVRAEQLLGGKCLDDARDGSQEAVPEMRATALTWFLSVSRMWDRSRWVILFFFKDKKQS